VHTGLPPPEFVPATLSATVVPVTFVDPADAATVTTGAFDPVGALLAASHSTAALLGPTVMVEPRL
jgi:D-arabinose 5-phosphate isomerase GutQ